MLQEEEEIHRKEILSLENEYQWVMKNEVHNVIKELGILLKECVDKFPLSICGFDKRAIEPDRFVLTTPSTTPIDQVKVMATLSGDSITQADINLKLPKPGNKDLYQNSFIREDSPWRLTQIQDSANHLQMAVTELDAVESDAQFKSSEEVDSILARILSSLQRSRMALVSPRKRTLEELNNSRQMKSLQPPLPSELSLSFFLQGFKLIFAVYHVVPDKNTTRFNRYQAECTVPWINEVLVLLTVAMQTVQQLKDKVNVFSQYQDVSMQSPCTSIAE